MSGFTRAGDASPPRRSYGRAMEFLAVHSTRFVRQRAAHVVALGACLVPVGSPHITAPATGPTPLVRLTRRRVSAATNRQAVRRRLVCRAKALLSRPAGNREL